MNFKDTMILDQALNAMRSECVGNCNPCRCGGNCSCHAKESPKTEIPKRMTPTPTPAPKKERDDGLSALFQALFMPYVVGDIANYAHTPAPAKLTEIPTKSLELVDFKFNDDTGLLNLKWSDGTTTTVEADRDWWDPDIEKAFAFAIMCKSIGIRRVIQQDNATVILWQTGEKTVVRCQNDDRYNQEKGFYMAFAKYMLGNTHKYYDVFKKCIPDL